MIHTTMNSIPLPSSISDGHSSDAGKEPVVGIFWDYESCPPPQEHPGSAVVQRIHSLAIRSGSIRVFNVYVDLETQQTKPKTATGLRNGLREEFHSLGVSVLDCPSLKLTKTVADKMIIVDLFTFASANRSEPVTLVVISGDPDLAYALSLLRQRHCRITVISGSLKSKGAGIAPGFQAEDLLTWEDIINNRERVPFGQTKHMHPSDTTTISSAPPTCRPNASEPEAVPSVQADATANQPVIRSGNSVSTVTVKTTSLDPPPAVSNQQPVPSSMPSQKTNPSSSSDRTPSYSKELQDVIAVLGTARRQRGWPACEVQNQLRVQRKLVMNERTVIEYLEEGIRLGILKHKIKPPSGNRLSPLTYYAVKKAK